MGRTIALFLAICLLSSCSFSLIDVKIVKNSPDTAKPDTNSGDSPPNPEALAELRQRSIQEAKDGTKKFVSNAGIAQGFADAVGLDIGSNCVQVAELSNGDIVGDFSNASCPAGENFIPEENLMFTLRALEPESSLTFTIVLEDEDKVFGTASVDAIAKSITLDELCTNDHADNCTLTVEDSKFKSFEEL